jgi:hypothetical protein
MRKKDAREIGFARLAKTHTETQRDWFRETGQDPHRDAEACRACQCHKLHAR